MGKKLRTRKSRLLVSLILVLLALIAALLRGVIDFSAFLETVILFLALFFAAASLVILGGIAGSPRFRRVRAFNPSSRLLKKVEVKKDPPSDPPPPIEWPDPVLDDVPSDPPVGTPPVTKEASYDEPFDTEVEKVLVTITTDDPVLTANFELEVPNPGTSEFIDEVDVLVLDVGTGLKAKAWVYYGTDVNLPLSQSPVVRANFS